MNQGVAFALSAYIFWGLHPIYWKLLDDVPSTEIVSHRIVWSFLFFFFIILMKKDWTSLINKIRNSKNKFPLFFPAFLIGSNWATYIWAVNANFIIETSLGYFICPLISIFLGVFFLNERLRKLQWLAIAIAGTGVLYMTFFYGHFPWISLYLAITWGTYGMLRKKSILNAVEGLLLETAVLSIPIIFYLFHLYSSGQSSFLTNRMTSILLVGSGIISGLPLIIFISGAKLINLSLIGILQYIYPTLIFLIGFAVFKEPFSSSKLIGFLFIWSALAIYSIDSTIAFNKKTRIAASN